MEEAMVAGKKNVLRYAKTGLRATATRKCRCDEEAVTLARRCCLLVLVVAAVAAAAAAVTS